MIISMILFVGLSYFCMVGEIYVSFVWSVCCVICLVCMGYLSFLPTSYIHVGSGFAHAFPCIFTAITTC